MHWGQQGEGGKPDTRQVALVFPVDGRSVQCFLRAELVRHLLGKRFWEATIDELLNAFRCLGFRVCGVAGSPDFGVGGERG